MKKISLFIIIIASIFIVISQTMLLLEIDSYCANKMFALSFIALGVGAILLGSWGLMNKKEKQ